MISAFQTTAFQRTAFQVGSAVGGYGGSAKKRYIVRKGDRLLMFSDEADALTVLSTTNQPQEIEAPEVVEKPTKKEVRKVEAKAEVVPIQYVQEIAKVYDEFEAVNRMLAQAQYQALIELFQRMREEEDIELLLMAA